MILTLGAPAGQGRTWVRTPIRGRAALGEKKALLLPTLQYCLGTAEAFVVWRQRGASLIDIEIISLFSLPASLSKYCSIKHLIADNYPNITVNGGRLPGPGMHLWLQRAPECFLPCRRATWLASLGWGLAMTPYHFQVRITLIKSKLFSVVRSQNVNRVGDKHQRHCFLDWVLFSMCGRNSRLESSVSRLSFFSFLFFPLLIKTTRLMIKHNTSLASMLPKGQGQNVTSRGIGEDPTATTVFGCQGGPQAPQDQLSLGFCSRRQSRCVSR